MNQHPSPRSSSGRLFFGGALILFGGILLLGDLGLLLGYRLDELWPLALIWLGLVQLIAGTPPGHRKRGILWALGGGLALVHTLSLASFRWQVIWPALLIYFGLSILLRKKAPSQPADGGPKPSSGSEDPRVRVDLTLTGAQNSFDGRSFEGGSIRCLMAGYELDLRGAEMVGPSAELLVDATLGGIEIKVPRSWRVENETSATLGAVENRTHFVEDADARCLFVRGRVLLGGIEVRN